MYYLVTSIDVRPGVPGGLAPPPRTPLASGLRGRTTPGQAPDPLPAAPQIISEHGYHDV